MKWSYSNNMTVLLGVCMISNGSPRIRYMRGTPGGAQLIVGSFDSDMFTALGPTLGLTVLNFDSPHGVMGGFWLLMENASSYMVYLRALSGARRDRLQTPFKSAGGVALWAFKTSGF